MTDKMINNRVKKLRELEEEAAILKDQIEAIKDELKDEMDGRNVDAISTKLFNIFYSCYSQKKVDTQKLKDAGIYDKYTKQVPVTKFMVTNVNPL